MRIASVLAVLALLVGTLSAHAGPQRLTGITQSASYRALVGAEAAYAAATSPTQAAVLGQAAVDQAEAQAWNALVPVLHTFLLDPKAMTLRHTTLQTALNAADTAHTLGYVVSDFKSVLGRLRFVTLATAGPPTFSNTGAVSGWPGDAYRAGVPERMEQLLIWTPPGESPRVQDLGDQRDYRFLQPPGQRWSLLGLIPYDAAAWRTAAGSWYLTVLAVDDEGQRSYPDYAEGLKLVRGVWINQPSMIPPAISRPYTAPLLVQELSFTDRSARAIRLFAAFLEKNECMACEQVQEYRLFLRQTTTYVAQPWHLIPSPYATLLGLQHAVQLVDSLGAACDARTFTGILALPSLLAQLCNGPALRIPRAVWETMPVNTNNPGPPYHPVPTIYRYSSAPGTLRVTITLTAGQWLVSALSWQPADQAASPGTASTPVPQGGVWGYCADRYPGHDMLFLAKGGYAAALCQYLTQHTIAGFGRLEAVNRDLYHWNAANDTFSFQIDSGVGALSHVCTYNYRVSGQTGVLGVYDDGFEDYGQQLCRYLSEGKIETGSPTYDNWS